jgi:hypothetical protein
VRTPADWTARLIEASVPEARFQVDRLALVRSTLQAEAAVHETIAFAGLGDAPATAR